ncbi:Protein CBR-RPI-2 [Caenorhabditis briggsae]|uniref:Protein CBR-RPI-2 n=1 Tax=Caenorhabditis briggsae TaxID=6238 RepID=A8XI92_CAEBR|nr:Protein CBR-RPI-2 [Caenorhabditis briggsae]CAP32366.2 Protein CBR-RPI-2 [Caenorhabditis briggsae]
MSCCFSKKLFSRRSHREDRYKVEEANGEPKPAEGTGEAPKYSWERREKANPEDYTVKDVKDKTVRKVGKDGGPLEIDNCQSSGQEEILKVNTVILKPSPADFIPRFSEIKDNDPTYAYICGKSEPVDELGDSAIELLHCVYKAKMEVMSSYDVEVKTVDPKLISFAGNAERVIILELSGDLLQLEYDLDMGVIQQDEMEQFQKLLIHLNSKKSG